MFDYLLGNFFGFDHGDEQDGMFHDDMFAGYAESSFHYEGHASGILLVSGILTQ